MSMCRRIAQRLFARGLFFEMIADICKISMSVKFLGMCIDGETQMSKATVLANQVIEKRNVNGHVLLDSCSLSS
uniref:Uncharacterized protein n=1 Tax=Romanomermis culicivorax TaxID=13658 RepID=A0A915HW80_ROMCU